MNKSGVFKTFKLVQDDAGQQDIAEEANPPVTASDHEGGPAFSEFPTELQNSAKQIWSAIKGQITVDISGAIQYFAPPLQGTYYLKNYVVKHRYYSTNPIQVPVLSLWLNGLWAIKMSRKEDRLMPFVSFVLS